MESKTTMRAILDKLREHPECLEEPISSAPAPASAIQHIQHIRHYMDQYERLIISIDQDMSKIDEEIRKLQERLDQLHKIKNNNLRAKQLRIEELNDVLQIVQNREGEQNAQHTNPRR